MNVLELKGGLLEMVANVRDEAILIQLQSAFKKVIQPENDLWDELSDERKKLLDQAIEESYDPNNWIDHEEVKKKHAKWLSK